MIYWDRPLITYFSWSQPVHYYVLSSFLQQIDISEFGRCPCENVKSILMEDATTPCLLELQPFDFLYTDSHFWKRCRGFLARFSYKGLSLHSPFYVKLVSSINNGNRCKYDGLLYNCSRYLSRQLFSLPF